MCVKVRTTFITKPHLTILGLVELTHSSIYLRSHTSVDTLNESELGLSILERICGNEAGAHLMGDYFLIFFFLSEHKDKEVPKGLLSL